MGSSKLIAIKPRNHLETQTSAYTLVAYGERARVGTFKVTVYLHSQGGQKGRPRKKTVQTGGGGLRGPGAWWWRLGEAGARGSGEEVCPPCTPAVMEATWMLSGGYRRQRVYGAPESQPQGGVGIGRRGATGVWGLWALQMASSAPVASLPSSHPGWSRDGKEKGADGGDTEFYPQFQPGRPKSSWG